jgi:hypothetical protein
LVGCITAPARGCNNVSAKGLPCYFFTFGERVRVAKDVLFENARASNAPLDQRAGRSSASIDLQGSMSSVADRKLDPGQPRQPHYKSGHLKIESSGAEVGPVLIAVKPLSRKLSISPVDSSTWKDAHERTGSIRRPALAPCRRSSAGSAPLPPLAIPKT